jgi:hypothetical protein
MKIMIDGDIFKVCGELRPKVSECLEEFGVQNDATERRRLLKIASDVGDYDPADLSLSDERAYKFFEKTLGTASPVGMNKSFTHFLDAVSKVARDNYEARMMMKALLEVKGQTFEDRTIMEIRQSFSQSDIMENSISVMTDTVSDALIPMLASDTDGFLPVILALYSEVRALAEEYLPKYDASELITKLDEHLPSDSTDMLKDFRDASQPDAPFMQMLSKLGDGIMEEVSGIVNDNAEAVCKGLVNIRRITAFLSALYMMIGTGRMGLDENKRLADKIAMTVKLSTQTVDKNAGILELEEADHTDLVINLN